MSLRDELPSKASDTVNFSRVKYDEQVEIDWQMEQFIANGGSIETLPLGHTKNKNGEPVCANEFDPTKPNEYEDRKEKGKKGAAANRKMKTKPTNDFGEW